MKEELRELVKKHFNLVDANVSTETEMASEQSFGEIKTADGELTLTYEGEELAVELPIFVVTPDGNIAAPDGTHVLEGGITIETEGGLIKEISKEESEEDVEVEIEIEAETKEEMSEETPEETKEEMESEVELETEEEMETEVASEESLSSNEEIILALSEIITPMIEEMKKDIEEMKSKFEKTEEKVETFSKAPAIEKTIATIKSQNKSNLNVDFKPLTDDKAKQFERLVNLRNKKN